MKRHLATALVGLIASLATLNAIPDQVGLFIANSSQRVEDFAFDDDTWSAEKLSEEWKLQTATEESREDIYRLNKAFVVFGVRAEEVSAVKLDGDLSRLLVTYRPDAKRKATYESLVKSLLTNIEAYTGETLVKAGGSGYRGRYKDFEIHLGKRAQDRVLVAIRRVPA